jgi:NAD(P)-dependent dehydrogenase (short-subunit alcohol dehydrogenase family)
MKRFKYKVAVITGGNSGIGLATAQRFVADGAYVFITDCRPSELEVIFRVTMYVLRKALILGLFNC